MRTRTNPYPALPPQTLAIAGALAAAGIVAEAGSAARLPTEAKAQAKHVILFIGDGMQLEHEIATSRYLTGEDFGLVWHSAQYQAPVSTWDVTTYNKYASVLGAAPYSPGGFDPLVGYSPEWGGRRPYPLDPTGEDGYFLTPIPSTMGQPATDSASAGTALSCGLKTDDGNLAWLPGDPVDGKLKTIAEYARGQRGAAIGVVSTVPFSHATPAAFVSHNISRNNYTQIANEIIHAVQPEVVIGGGHRGWGGNYLSAADQAALETGATAYTYVGRTAGADGGTALLTAAAAVNLHAGQKLFGLFGGKGGNFESPVPLAAPGQPQVLPATLENPSLKDATLAALQVLGQDPDGFFVMIEQGDIDWANHDNDFARMIGCTYDLNEAVQAAIAFINQPGDSLDWGNTLLLVTSDHGNSYLRLNRHQGVPVLGLGELPQQVKNTDGVVVQNDFYRYKPGYLYPDGQATYGTGNHTDELVMLYAWGKGINFLARAQGDWYRGTQIIDNTQIFSAMAAALGLNVAQ